MHGARPVSILTATMISAILLAACPPSSPTGRPQPGGDDCTYCQGVAQKAFDDCIKSCGSPLPEGCCDFSGCCGQCAGLTGAQGNAFSACCGQQGRNCNGDPNSCVDPPPSNNPCDDAAARTRAKTPR
jgi:hypothetical protein